VLIANRPIDLATAEEVNKIFFEVIIAPEYAPEALEVLKQKKNRIILVQKQPNTATKQYRSLLGGVLVQDRDLHTEQPEELRQATDRAVDADRIADLHTKVLDTRKTTPGMRVLEKMAVKMGGGENHRIGLFDMILLKDNHIDFAGGVAKAVTGAKEYLKAKGKNIPIECEVRSLEDIKEVFAAGGVDRIMFDNFSVEQTREAVALVAGRCETESSGGITLETLRDYAETGVDFISVGALTHQIKSLDMSLKAC
jgi:hypothetical protein